MFKCVDVFFFSFSYQLLLLKPSTKALSQASKVCIRTDSRGFLSLQYMIRIEDGQICFVEYLVSILNCVQLSKMFLKLTLCVVIVHIDTACRGDCTVVLS